MTCGAVGNGLLICDTVDVQIGHLADHWLYIKLAHVGAGIRG